MSDSTLIQRHGGALVANGKREPMPDGSYRFHVILETCIVILFNGPRPPLGTRLIATHGGVDVTNVLRGDGHNRPAAADPNQMTWFVRIATKSTQRTGSTRAITAVDSGLPLVISYGNKSVALMCHSHLRMLDEFAQARRLALLPALNSDAYKCVPVARSGQILPAPPPVVIHGVGFDNCYTIDGHWYTILWLPKDKSLSVHVDTTSNMPPPLWLVECGTLWGDNSQLLPANSLDVKYEAMSPPAGGSFRHFFRVTFRRLTTNTKTCVLPFRLCSDRLQSHPVCVMTTDALAKAKARTLLTPSTSTSTSSSSSSSSSSSPSSSSSSSSSSASSSSSPWASSFSSTPRSPTSTQHVQIASTAITTTTKTTTTAAVAAQQCLASGHTLPASSTTMAFMGPPPSGLRYSMQQIDAWSSRPTLFPEAVSAAPKLHSSSQQSAYSSPFHASEAAAAAAAAAQPLPQCWSSSVSSSSMLSSPSAVLSSSSSSLLSSVQHHDTTNMTSSATAARLLVPAEPSQRRDDANAAWLASALQHGNVSDHTTFGGVAHGQDVWSGELAVDGGEDVAAMPTGALINAQLDHVGGAGSMMEADTGAGACLYDLPTCDMDVSFPDLPGGWLSY